MNDRERFNLIEQRLGVVEREQGLLKSALQFVWTWLMNNKAFFDSLPFETEQKKPEEKKEPLKTDSLIQP